MLGGFILIISFGHSYCVIMVVSLMILLFRELLNLKRDANREEPIPNFYKLNWYFFMLTLFFLIPRFLPAETKNQLFSDPTLGLLHFYSPLSLFIAFMGGILMFVLSLRQGMYRYQFKLIAWTIVTLLFVICQLSSLIYNIYSGIFWFLFPSLCVVGNDTFAYLFGFFLGRTPLIKLSPKKTWEGFIGGGFGTIVAS